MLELLLLWFAVGLASACGCIFILWFLRFDITIKYLLMIIPGTIVGLFSTLIFLSFAMAFILVLYEDKVDFNRVVIKRRRK